MKKLLIIIMITFLGLTKASTDIIGLSCDYSAGIVKIEWKTGIESSIKEFRIEKSSDNINYNILTTEEPKGSSSSYTILDQNPYSKRTVLYYRIAVADYDGSEKISDPVSIIVDTSGIGATWGSIKAMFR